MISKAIFFAHAQMQNSVNKKELNSDIKRDKLMEFRRIVCWMFGKHYQVLVNTFCPILCQEKNIVVLRFHFC